MFDWIKRVIFRGKSDKKSIKAEDEIQNTIQEPDGKQSTESFPENKAGTWAERGMITRTCKKCGKTFTLPEEVQHWPDYCQECRRKYEIVEQITRKCRGCGKEFTFPSNIRHWPNYCRDCQAKRKSGNRPVGA